jgi:osmoprotectant transport system permease protein
VNGAGILRVVPSLAVLFLLIPLLHTGFKPALVALTLLAIPPLLINTNAGLRGVDRNIVEAGRGMGMSYWQLLGRLQMPLAMPVVIAGLRAASIEVIGSATLASLIGAGGLGDFIAIGLSLSRNWILLAGAIPVALIALTAELSLATLQGRLERREGMA